VLALLAILTLLPLLTALPLLALRVLILPVAALLAVLSLLPVAHLLLHAIDAAHEILRFVEISSHLVVLVALTHCRLRLAELVAQRIESGADVAFDLVAGPPAAQHAVGVVPLFLQLVVANRIA